jgi:hypothetical protein
MQASRIQTSVFILGDYIRSGGHSLLRRLGDEVVRDFGLLGWGGILVIAPDGTYSQQLDFRRVTR